VPGPPSGPGLAPAVASDACRGLERMGCGRRSRLALPVRTSRALHEPSEALAFLESSFFDWALGVALHERYNGREQTPYQRRKALVLRVLPEAARGALPREKATFATAFEKYHRHTFCGAPRLIEHGIVVASLPEGKMDPTMLHRLQGVDDWVRSAEEAGSQPSEG
jgi:hypothetical protein